MTGWASIAEGERQEGSQAPDLTINKDFESDGNYTFISAGINIYNNAAAANCVVRFFTYINSGWRKMYEKNMIGNDYAQYYIPILSRKVRIQIQTFSGVSAYYECICSYKKCPSALYLNDHDY